MAAGSFIVEENSLSQYLKEISKNRTLSFPEEAELAVKIRKGCTKSLHKLVSANLRFVVSVARNYQNQGLPLADLINEGNLGLIRAARRFDETKKFKFISYAVWWVRQAILQSLAEQSRIYKLPLNRVATIHKIGKTMGKLSQKYGRTPNAKEIAKELKLDEQEIMETMKIENNHLSLDSPLKAGKDGRLYDIIEDPNITSPDESSVASSANEVVVKTLETLNRREAEVIKLYYGIGVDNPHTLEEIGKKFNLTRERVRQIKEKALKRLKHSSRSKSLKKYNH
ncbi:MAG: RNA polymerase sigma factor RpoD/SigA [Fibrobacterota bacterium]